MLDRRTLIYAGLTAAGLGAFAWYGNHVLEQYELGGTDPLGWEAMAWPFPRDAWPPGRAWNRDGTEVYVRVKLGLCGNCETGVVTDEELDRVVDIDLLHDGFKPMQPGGRIRITDLFGRARIYKRRSWTGNELHAEGIAVSHNCDLIVAIVSGNVTDEATRKAAHAVIESNTVQVWVNKQLEGR